LAYAESLAQWSTDPDAKTRAEPGGRHAALSDGSRSETWRRCAAPTGRRCCP